MGVVFYATKINKVLPPIIDNNGDVNEKDILYIYKRKSYTHIYLKLNSGLGSIHLAHPGN